jgi:hypothetical protein
VTAAPHHLLLDMAMPNPGQPLPDSAYLDPQTLHQRGFNGQVLYSTIEGVPQFAASAPGAIASGSPEAQWANSTADALAARIDAAKQQGILVLAWMQCLVFPKAIVARFASEICDHRNRIDIARPRTQALLREQVAEIFARLPHLDGLVIRTGEIYLYGMPYHTATAPKATEDHSLRQSSTAILNGEQSHKTLLEVLRSEVCERHNKHLVYRTWDFGNNFHTNPRYYLAVTDAIAPHPNLVFSIKHQAADFLRLTPFNPTLAIGRHRQIIEVQCQREAYGKGAHPYYVGKGVIDGWEEDAWLMKPGEPHGLRDIVSGPRFAGLWTWSRGGGWDGPVIRNEFWCALNAQTMSHYTRNPRLGEEASFYAAARDLRMNTAQLPVLRKLCLLSSDAVLRGQLTALGADINPWWSRDDKFEAPGLDDFLHKGIVEQAIAEKQQAVAMWREIEQLSQQLHIEDEQLDAFVRASATYGRLKYTVVQQAWTALLLQKSNAATGDDDSPRIREALAQYDLAWQQWHQLAADQPQCSSPYLDVGFDGRPGIGAAIDACRKSIA